MVENNSKGFITLLLVGLVFVVAFFLVGGSSIFNDAINPVSTQTYQIDTNSSSSQVDKSLQLRTIGFSALPSNTPAPGSPTNTPTPVVGAPIPTGPTLYCPINRRRPGTCGCDPDQREVLECDDPIICSGRIPYPCIIGKELPEFNTYVNHPRCKAYCFGKPVIYLYPEYELFVDVAIDTPGNIFISIPEYPAGGWKNVYAYPSGRLIYNENEYKELYYEIEVENVKPPINGIVIPKAFLEFKLRSLLQQLGLNKIESNDFLAYWLPKLEKLDEDYVLFSLIEEEEKERIDNVKISPEPQTRIEFLVYFKGLKQFIEVPPLILPQTPTRKGFTMVEWGGTIDYGKKDILDKI